MRSRVILCEYGVPAMSSNLAVTKKGSGRAAITYQMGLGVANVSSAAESAGVNSVPLMYISNIHPGGAGLSLAGKTNKDGACGASKGVGDATKGRNPIVCVPPF